MQLELDSAKAIHSQQLRHKDEKIEDMGRNHLMEVCVGIGAVPSVWPVGWGGGGSGGAEGKTKVYFSCTCCFKTSPEDVFWVWVCGCLGLGGQISPPPPLWLLEAPVRKMIPQRHTPSALKSVLEAANPRMDSEGASGCPWSAARATARLRDGRPPE